MIFRELDIAGVHLVSPEPVSDERGTFVRLFGVDEFAALGVNPRIEQVSVATNSRRGTLRGMHLQAPPHGESKLLRCTRGSVFDVLVDLRPMSKTLLTWIGVILTSDAREALSVPEGIAHGYLTLEDDCEMEYLISAAYEPAAAIGIRWDDPAVGVQWPFAPRIVGARDKALPFVDRNRLRAEGLASLRHEGAQP